MSEAVYEEEINQEEDVATEIAQEAGDSRFVIDDDGKANWAIQKIKKAQAEIEQWKTYYKGALEKIEKRQGSRIEYLKSLLYGYFGTVPHKETKTQASYELPSGKLIMKQPGPKFETDDSVLIPWLKENGMDEYVKTEIKEKAAWGELKKTVTVNGGEVVSQDGEIIPGVTVTEQEPTFDIK